MNWLRLILLLVAVFGVPSFSDVRGIRPKDQSLYSGQSFRCKDGSQLIPISLVNDDYCDCKDGSDEPGTAACPTGQFWCTNKGFKGQYVSSSRVNDKVCDCCDGSDEYKSGAPCLDTCKQAGQDAQKGALDQIRIVEEGAKIRAEWIEQAKITTAEKKSALETLKKELEEAKNKLEAAREKKEAEEKLEQAERDRIDAERQANATAAAAAGQATPDATVSGDKKIEGEVVSQEFAEFAAANAKAAEDEKKKKEEEAAAFPYPAEYAYHGDDNKPKEEEKPAVEEELTIEPKRKAVEPVETPVSLPAADAARKEFNDADSAKRELDKKIEAIEKWLANDYGPNGEFAQLEGKCFSIKIKQYEYQFCAYNDAKQKEGYSDTSLGRWKGWDTGRQDKYSAMLFQDGIRCWQGPDRSLTVTLQCSNTNEVLAVDEPNKCVYTMKFGTPAACNLEHAKALRLNLDTQYSDDADGHHH